MKKINNSNFIHLHVHSEYTLECGIIRIKDYIQYALKNNIFSIALTERFNLFSALTFYKECINYGIKPLIGIDILVDIESFPFYGRFIFLCQNVIGYNNLIKLLTKAHLENPDNIFFKREWLLSLSEGLIVIGLSTESDIGIFLLQNKIDLANKILYFWKSLFKDRFYISINSYLLENEFDFLNLLIDLSINKKIPLVATNEVYCLYKNDYLACYSKQVINNINNVGFSDELSFFFKDKYFKTEDEMIFVFKNFLGAIENTIEISKRCNLFFELKDNYISKFYYSDNYFSEEYLFRLSICGLISKFHLGNKSYWDIYSNKLISELDVINKTGFSDYFLATFDFINSSKLINVLVGPSRGSGGGSLTAYSLSITGIDPLEYGLLFERFLNIERISSPDFDVDFCIEGRDYIVDFVTNFYGIKSVSQIITFGTMASKAVVRDIGRILGYPYGFVDKISKLVIDDISSELKLGVIEDNNLLGYYNNSEDVKSIIDLSLKLENLSKSVGKHAGGLVISLFNLTNYLPLSYSDDDSQIITQFDKDNVEDLGLIKFDFLGLKTLTIIESIMEDVLSYINFVGFLNFDISNISLFNKKTFFLLKSSNTSGVFQLESTGIKNILYRLSIDRFEDLIALLALYRPGPLKSGMVDDFIDRKLGIEKIDYIHDLLKPILIDTYGVIVYQEQVMKIAQILSGYSLGHADLLRSAMSKKKKEEMSDHFKKFINGAVSKGVDIFTAENIFNLIEKFASYGFNKSHSVGYALLSYQTAWLKSNYCSHFMVSLLSSDMSDSEKMRSYINDSKNLGIKICLPNINCSIYSFALSNVDEIIYGFGAIKGVGESVIAELIFNRSKYGFFKDFYDFLFRIDLKKINKKTFDSLVNSGAFDCFLLSRFDMINIFHTITSSLEKNYFKDKYFYDLLLDKYSYAKNNFFLKTKWTKFNELKSEKLLLGDYISIHPVNYYLNELNNVITSNIRSIILTGDKENNVIFGLIIDVKFLNLFSGSCIILIIEDLTGVIEVIVSKYNYECNRKILKKDELIIVKGYFKKSKFISSSFYSLFEFRLEFVKYLDIKLSFFSNEIFNSLLEILNLDLNLNGCFVRLYVDNLLSDFSYGKLKIFPTDDLIRRLKCFDFVKEINLIYF